jgi:hypothetical protein
MTADRLFSASGCSRPGALRAGPASAKKRDIVNFMNFTSKKGEGQ